MTNYLVALSVYLRHRQYVVYYEHTLGQKRGWWRITSFILMQIGFFSAFGMSMVANFQETSVAAAHFTGAMIAFFGSTIYVWGQIFLSYSMMPRMTPLWLNTIRAFFAAIATAALILRKLFSGVPKAFVSYRNNLRYDL